mgnify:CR=1 FL=1
MGWAPTVSIAQSATRVIFPRDIGYIDNVYIMGNSMEEVQQLVDELRPSVTGEAAEKLDAIAERTNSVFEACSFQDLTGQRITKAMTALQLAEERIARVLEAWGGIEQFRRNAPRPANPKLVNGPKLNGDSGHATQQDVDKMFA